MARRLFAPALVLLTALLACWPALRGDFVYDDEYYVLHNPAVIGAASPWTSPLGEPDQALWRPLTVATFRAQWDGTGDARPFRAVNVALHALAALALLGLARALGLGAGASLAAALLFAVHPVHAEAVAWVSGRSELLAALFVLVAWRAHLSPARGAAGVSALMLGLALLSKESAAVAPLLFALVDIARRRGAAAVGGGVGTPVGVPVGAEVSAAAGVSGLTEAGTGAGIAAGTPVGFSSSRLVPWRRLALLGAVVLAAALVRSAVLPQALPSDAPFGDLSLPERALVAANILGRAFTLLAWPAGLRVFHHRSEFTSPQVAWLTTAALALLLAVLLRRRQPLAAALLLAVPAALLTVLNLVPIGATFAERFLYLPSAAACLCAGTLLAARCRAELRGGRGLGTSVLVTLLALGVAVPACRRAVAVFHDDLSIWARAARVAPQLAHTRYNHGYFLEAEGHLLAEDRDRPGAADELNESLRLDPRHLYAAFAHQILGNLAMNREGHRLADPNLAAVHYRAAIERLPALVDARINLASLALQAPAVVARAEALEVLAGVERTPDASAQQRSVAAELRAQLLAPESPPAPEPGAAPEAGESGAGSPTGTSSPAAPRNAK